MREWVQLVETSKMEAQASKHALMRQKWKSKCDGCFERLER